LWVSSDRQVRGRGSLAQNLPNEGGFAYLAGTRQYLNQPGWLSQAILELRGDRAQKFGIHRSIIH
jgi:hypothetical protein